MGGSQEYTLMLAKKMSVLNPTILAMPFDDSQDRYRKEILAEGGTIFLINSNIQKWINSRSYFHRIYAAYRLACLMKESFWYPHDGKIILHAGLNPIAFSVLALRLGPNTRAVNVFHDFGSIRKKSISYFANTIFLLPGKFLNWKYITPSEAVSTILTTKVAAFVRKNVTVIHTGIEPVPFVAPTQISHSALIFGMIGRVSEAKAWDVWLDAAMLVLKNSQKSEFHWFGDGPDIRKAQSRAASYKENIFFEGPVGSIISALDSVNVFVLSSRWEGGCLPRSVLEAMFRGVPCILPRLPSLIEGVGKVNCCIWYEPDNVHSLAAAMELAMSNATELSMIAATARKLVEKAHRAQDEFNVTAGIYSEF
jgi:glycosyltransferase involved in cell wall biosynthesis